jgi:hypothetical protein
MSYHQKTREFTLQPSRKHRKLFVSATALLSILWLVACSPVLEASPTTGQAGKPSQQSSPTITQTTSPSIRGTPTPTSNEVLPTRPPDNLPPGLEPIPSQEVTPVVGEVPSQLMDKILADLEKRLGVNRQAIQVERAEAVVWNNGSLGCPVPGQFYTQALVNGYWVVLRVDSKDYDYRASQSGFFTLCERSIPRP